MNIKQIETALDDLKNGKIIIVTDDADRENEGDFICAAEFATPENINFMATYGKGLICMPMSSEIINRLELNQMVDTNTDNHCTAFTVSIDYKTTSTGISAFERSETAIMSVSDTAKPEDFRRPGHMFPLQAKNGGVLERGGHTEATVDLMKLAGLKPAGLCCEIMSSDGHMMRGGEIQELAEKYQLTLISIEELREYIRYKNGGVTRSIEAKLPTKYGCFKIIGYENHDKTEHHIALTMGDLSKNNPVMVRIHSECLTGDVFGSSKCDCGDQLAYAMELISKTGSGILIYLRQEGRGIGLINKLKAYSLQDKGMDTVEANLALGFEADLRDYSAAVDILKDLGVSQIRLITNNPQKISSIEKHGITVAERISALTPYKPESCFYMHTKKEKFGHLINDEN